MHPQDVLLEAMTAVKVGEDTPELRQRMCARLDESIRAIFLNRGRDDGKTPGN